MGRVGDASASLINKEGPLRGPSASVYLRLLARAVGAAAAGGIAGGAGIAAAVTVVVGHVVDPFYVWLWRLRVKKRGYCVAPRKVSWPNLLISAVPVLVVVRIALVRVVIAIGLGIVGHGGLLSMAGSGIRRSGREVGRRGDADG